MDPARRTHRHGGSRARGGAGGPLRSAGLLELARGRDADALAAFQAAERLAGRLAAPQPARPAGRGHSWCTSWCASATPSAPSRPSPDSTNQDRERGDMRIATATLRLAQDDPRAATAALAPVLDGSAPRTPGDLAGSGVPAGGDRPGRARRPGCRRPAPLERALDLAEPDGATAVFLLHPVPGLLERQARHRTAHAALIAEILSLLAGRRPAPPPAGPRPPLEPLSDSEIRVLRYLPTNLTGPEIAGELYVSHNTVRTHIRHLYAKLGTHTRAEAVARARALGLLAPSPLHGQATRPG